MAHVTSCSVTEESKSRRSKWRLKIQDPFVPSLAVCTDMYCVLHHLHLSLPPSIAYVKNLCKMII